MYLTTDPSGQMLPPSSEGFQGEAGERGVFVRTEAGCDIRGKVEAVRSQMGKSVLQEEDGPHSIGRRTAPQDLDRRILH